MSIEEIRIKYEANGMPYPISLDEAKRTIRDINSLPSNGHDRWSYLNMAISERTDLFIKQQKHIEEMRERRGRFLKPFITQYV